MSLKSIGGYLTEGEIDVPTLGAAIKQFGVYRIDSLGETLRFPPDHPLTEGVLDALAEVVAMDEAGRHSSGNAFEGGEDAALCLFDYGWPADELPPFKVLQRDRAKAAKRPGQSRETQAHQAIIGALLAFITGKLSPSGQPHGDYTSQADLIAFLVEKYDGFEGLSKSNLERRLAEANARLERT